MIGTVKIKSFEAHRHQGLLQILEWNYASYEENSQSENAHIWEHIQADPNVLFL